MKVLSNHKKMISIGILVVLGIIGGFLIVKAENLRYKKIIELPPSDDNHILKITQDSDYSLTVKLSKGKRLIKLVSFGNTGTKDSLIRKVNMDDKNDKEYAITVYDRGSTYGAQTNIIVWKEGIHWNLTCAPFERGHIKDKDKDGVYEIYSSQKEQTYSFREGLFVKENNK